MRNLFKILWRGEKYILLTIITLSVNVWQTVAQEIPEIWYRPDSLIAMPTEDSITWTNEYTVFSVIRSFNADSIECLWSFAEDDTISNAVLTNSIYTPAIGCLSSHTPRDFSHWCIYSYHSGIRLDSTKHQTLRLGEQIAYRQDSTGLLTDSLHAHIEAEEFAYFSGNVSRLETSAFQTYLALKFGITLDYAAYLSPSGDTLWHPTDDEDYYNHVVGIGNDTIHAWMSNHSQSKEHAVLLIHADAVRPNEYVIMGDNDAPLVWQLEPDGSSTLQRNWRMRQYLDNPQMLTLTLQLSALGQADSLRLIVSAENGIELQHLMPDSIVGDSICYFSLNQSEPLLHLRLCGVVPNTPHDRSTTQRNSMLGNGAVAYVQYDAQSKTIVINGYPDGQIFELYLYDRAGKIISSLSSPNPIDVSMLPDGIFYIEITADNQIVGSIPLSTISY